MTVHYRLGDLADALALAKRTYPRLTWVVVPETQLPNGRYTVCADRQTMYFASSLTPEATFDAWIAAVRDLLDIVDCPGVVPLHFNNHAGRGKTG